MTPSIGLPSVEICHRRAQAMAMLDAVLSPEWEGRYFSFDTRWNVDEQMASMRDGSGDHVFMLFTQGGAVFKTFEHEQSQHHLDAAALRSSLPPELQPFLDEPAFMMDDCTGLGWTTGADWQVASTLDLSEHVFLRLLAAQGPAAMYAEWAGEYFEVELPTSAVQAVFDHQPLTEELVFELSPDLSLADLQEDQLEIGYP